MSKYINININESTEVISISGLRDAEVSVSYSSDIDFTELVRILADMIDNEEEITVTCDDVDEDKEKLKIVIETIKAIFEKYNESLSVEPEVEDDDLPF